MIKRASLIVLFGVGIVSAGAAHAQMQQGYANDKPDVTVDRSVLQDLKGYQPPPMFGGDLMPPTTNRVGPVPVTPVEVRKNVEVTSPTNQVPAAVVAPPAATLTAPNAEDLLNHPTQNFHVLTERNASMTAPNEPVDSPDGPLLPLPDDEYSAAEKLQAAKIKAAKPVQKEVVKKSDQKKSDKKKTDTQKVAVKKEKSAEPVKPTTTVKKETTKAGIVNKNDTAKGQGITSEAPKMIKPKPDAYRPKSPQSMPAIPPIQVEKNALPPMSNSALPSLPPTTDTTEAITKPTPGLRMMDAALERQMESDKTKIKEQLATTDVKTIPSGTEKVEIKKTEPTQKKTSVVKLSEKTLVFASNDTNVSDTLKAQIKKQILPDIQKAIENDKTSRIQIISFATSIDKTENSARRIALARSLAVRDYLKSLQIDTERMDVRALPSQGNSVPPDKVDIVLLK